MQNPKGYIAGVGEWRYPEAGDEEAPRGTQCLILTEHGICVRGVWTPGALAWSPFLKRDHAKEAFIKRNKGSARLLKKPHVI